MLDFGLSYKDWTRIAWTFAEGVIGWALVTWLNWIPGQPFSWKALVFGAGAAGIATVKNFALSDASRIK
jgi:hypothetical protein